MRGDTDGVPYELDPTLTDVPIHTSELEALMAEGAKDVLRDPRKFQHLMGRVLSTLRTRSETIQQLNKDINSMRMQAEQVGRASTLNPVDQVRFLSDEQKAQLCGSLVQEQLATMNREIERAQHLQRLANQILNRTKYALLALVEDTSIPQHARARVQEVLAAMEAGGPGSAGAPSQGGSHGTVRPHGVQPGPQQPGPQQPPAQGGGWGAQPAPFQAPPSAHGGWGSPA